MSMLRFSCGIRRRISQTLYDAVAPGGSIPHCCNQFSNDSSTSGPTGVTSNDGSTSGGQNTDSDSQGSKYSGEHDAMQNGMMNGKSNAIEASNLISENQVLTSRTGLSEFAQGTTGDDNNSETIANSATHAAFSNDNCNASGHNDVLLSKTVPETIPSYFGNTTGLPQTDQSSADSNHGNVTGSHGNIKREELEPPDPETCCGSGCVNCVYIKYVQEILDRDPNDRAKVKEVLDQIEDFNVKMFIKLELGL